MRYYRFTGNWMQFLNPAHPMGRGRAKGDSYELIRQTDARD
jgi:hypothetical protein